MVSKETHDWITETIEHATWLGEQRIKMYKEFLHYSYLYQKEQLELEKRAQAEGLDLPVLHELNNTEFRNSCSLVHFA